MLALVLERRVQVLAEREHQPDRVLGEGIVKDVPRVGEHDIARDQLGEEHCLDTCSPHLNPAELREVAPVVANVATADIPDQQCLGAGGLQRRLGRRIDEDVVHIWTRLEEVAAWRLGFDDSDQQSHGLTRQASIRSIEPASTSKSQLVAPSYSAMAIGTVEESRTP